MNILNKLLLAVVMMLPVASVSAQGWVWADVEYVQPRYDYEVRYETRRVCDNSHYEYRGDHNGSTQGSVVGAIIGGVIGNQFGDGNGRTVATIGGAAIGAGVGSNHGRDREYRNREYRYDNRYRGQRCWVERVPYRYRYIRGYDVTYYYNGYRGTVFVYDEPHDRIRISPRY